MTDRLCQFAASMRAALGHYTAPERRDLNASLDALDKVLDQRLKPVRPLEDIVRNIGRDI